MFDYNALFQVVFYCFFEMLFSKRFGMWLYKFIIDIWHMKFLQIFFFNLELQGFFSLFLKWIKYFKKKSDLVSTRKNYCCRLEEKVLGVILGLIEVAVLVGIILGALWGEEETMESNQKIVNNYTISWTGQKMPT